MEQTRKNNIPGIFASLDFSKAFDTLEWPCIQHPLKLFNFGEALRRWVKVFYNDIESAALSNKIRLSNEVKGIAMFNMEIKLSQFSDNTNLLCSDIISMKNTLMILESFGFGIKTKY